MFSAAAECIQQLCSTAPVEPPREPRRVLVVAAHPDDESVGLGTRLPRLNEAWDVTLAYATNGSPRNGVDAARWGMDRPTYAAARRRELEAALRLAGVATDHVRWLGCTDQEGWLHLGALTGLVAALLAEMRPEVVITHPYEGGHPDHDAAAFAVHAACAAARRSGREAPAIVEMTSYHMGSRGIEAGMFLPARSEDRADGAPGEPAAEGAVALSPQERAFKRRLFDCFATQRETLAYFPVEVERLRPAPRYDFTRAPHDGPLFYESQNWGATGEAFRRRAAAAMGRCGVAGAI